VDVEDNYKRTPLLNASFSGKANIVSWLIAQKANLNHQDVNGYTALHFCAQEGHLDCAKVLLTHSADPNIRDAHGNSAAWVAVMNWRGGSNFEMLKILLGSGADLEVKNVAGRSVMDLLPEKIKFDLGIHSA
jgi:ankyrin repeat protein